MTPIEHDQLIKNLADDLHEKDIRRTKASDRVNDASLKQRHVDSSNDRDDPRIIRTHISSVIMIGDDAYKLKRPVKFPFLDFSTQIGRAHV